MNSTAIAPTKGLAAARQLRALLSVQNMRQALAFAESQDWRDTPQVVQVLRAAVDAQTTGNSGVLVDATATDFAAYLRPTTLIGRIPGMRRVPFNVALLNGTGGATAYWTGEGAPIPLSAEAFERLFLAPARVSAILAVSNELFRFGQPYAEGSLRDDMVAAAGQAIDAAFIDPTNAGISNVKPASVTFGAPAMASSGADVASIDADVKLMIAQLLAAGSTLASAVWIMSPTTAAALNLKRGSGGAPAYPGVSATGGVFAGFPVFTSASVGAYMVLLPADQVAIADDGQADFAKSEQATIEMLTNPTNNSATATATTTVSMYQTNSSSVRVQRHVNWRLRRADMAAVLSGVSY